MNLTDFRGFGLESECNVSRFLIFAVSNVCKNEDLCTMYFKVLAGEKYNIM